MIPYALAKASGVSEVASVGGFVKRYQVIVDPQKLQAYGISRATVSQAIRSSSQYTGERAAAPLTATGGRILKTSDTGISPLMAIKTNHGV